MPIKTHDEKITAVKAFIQQHMGHEFELHDYLHAFRVLKNAQLILTKEPANHIIVETAALVHDFVDDKLFDTIDTQIKLLKELLTSLEYSSSEIEGILNIITHLSYSSGKVPESKEGKIVQDADRLDAIGAIGLLRPFTYGAVHSRPAYDSEVSSLSHFLEKKPKLKATLHTQPAKELAEQRDKIMYLFLQYLFAELDEDIYERKHFKKELKDLGIIT